MVYSYLQDPYLIQIMAIKARDANNSLIVGFRFKMMVNIMFSIRLGVIIFTFFLRDPEFTDIFKGKF